MVSTTAIAVASAGSRASSSGWVARGRWSCSNGVCMLAQWLRVLHGLCASPADESALDSGLSIGRLRSSRAEHIRGGLEDPIRRWLDSCGSQPAFRPWRLLRLVVVARGQREPPAQQQHLDAEMRWRLNPQVAKQKRLRVSRAARHGPARGGVLHGPFLSHFSNGAPPPILPSPLLPSAVVSCQHITAKSRKLVQFRFCSKSSTTHIQPPQPPLSNFNHRQCAPPPPPSPATKPRGHGRSSLEATPTLVKRSYLRACVAPPATPGT